jgi:phosphatidylglycerophosphate synthase
MTQGRMTLADVRASYNSNVKSHFSVGWFGRPLANLVTPFFFNIGSTANGVTGARVLLAVVCLAALALPGMGGAVFACVGFYICFVLDCVDGNLARLRGAVTYWGKFIDGLADFTFILGAPLAASIGIYWAGGDAVWVLAGCLVTAMSSISQMTRSRLSFFREWMVGQGGPLSDDVTRLAERSRRVQSRAAKIYVNGTFFMPLLLLVPDHGRVMFVVAAIMLQALPEVIWLGATIGEARIILARPRKSIHSPPVTDIND